MLNKTKKEIIMRKKQAGFSLVELMIVLVIIGILAAVGVPIYTSNMNKARQAEADATLGTIRTDLRVYYAENNSTYPVVATDSPVVGATWNNINATELTGKYFTDASYTYTGDGSIFTITCAGGNWLDTDRTLDQAGDFAGGMD